MKNHFAGFLAALFTMILCQLLDLPDFLSGFLSCMAYITARDQTFKP